MTEYVTELIARVKTKNPAEPEFHQAVQEVAESLTLVLERHPEYVKAKILERMISRSVSERSACPGRTTRRSALTAGPHQHEQRRTLQDYTPSVNSALKFAFEQVFKMPSRLCPWGCGRLRLRSQGKSDYEVMRFARPHGGTFRHIGAYTDVPAGDIGVGGREIASLRRTKTPQRITGVLTGKRLGWGGSLIRPQATGYGAVYFAWKCSKHARRDSKA
jgi:glutamate dehydrogenase (NADP+)